MPARERRPSGPGNHRPGDRRVRPAPFRELRTARKWWGVFAFFSGLAAAGLGAAGYFTAAAIASSAAGLPPLESWAAALVVDLAAGSLVVAWASLLFGMLTTVTAEGIRKPGLRGSTFIRWSDLVSVLSNGRLLEFRSRSQRIRLNPARYGDPRQVLAAISQQIPKHIQNQSQSQGRR